MLNITVAAPSEVEGGGKAVAEGPPRRRGAGVKGMADGCTVRGTNTK